MSDYDGFEPNQFRFLARHLLRRIPYFETLLRQSRERLFDLRYRVETSGEEDWRHTIASPNAHLGTFYSGTTPASGRLILRSLPVVDLSSYTFVDFGSGKGRMLLIASEYGFERIVGVEFASQLHELALRNITRYANRLQKCFDIVSLHLDAVDYELPRGNCVLYFYFPFRRPLMVEMLRRIETSFLTSPRHMFIIVHNTEIADVFDDFGTFELLRRSRHFNVYRPASPEPGRARPLSQGLTARTD